MTIDIERNRVLIPNYHPNVKNPSSRASYIPVNTTPALISSSMIALDSNGRHRDMLLQLDRKLDGVRTTAEGQSKRVRIPSACITSANEGNVSKALYSFNFPYNIELLSLI